MAPRSTRPVSPDGIPEKPYFKIGETARLLAVKPYVLRYWETEFRTVKPTKTTSGQRLYRRRDVEHLLRIRELLYEKRFTIEGARTALRQAGLDEAPAPALPPPDVDLDVLRKIKQQVVDLIRTVDD